MKTRLVLITLILLSIGSIFVSKQSAADPGGVPGQIKQLQATVDEIKESVLRIDPTIVGDTTLTTGMLLPSGGNDRIFCSVVNVSDKDVTVSISVVAISGIVKHNNILTVPPHEGSAIGSTNEFILAGYCRFNFSGAPNAIRAGGGFQDLESGYFKFVTDAR
jgi:hypothetical protein